ncbi:MAG: dockerin type I repeat-containing protein [Oscillospiraceae bacterium]|jgi:hypothetical protein|nr:dockerin type I repeat-containing protein [Oscillospiraceae bacterium]
MKKYKKIISLCLAFVLSVGSVGSVSADVSEYTKEQKDFIYSIAADIEVKTFEKYSEYCSKQGFDFTEDEIKLLYDKYYEALVEGSDGHIYLKEGLTETDDMCACDWASLIPIIDPDTLESIYDNHKKWQEDYIVSEVLRSNDINSFEDYVEYCKNVNSTLTNEEITLLYNKCCSTCLELYSYCFYFDAEEYGKKSIMTFDISLQLMENELIDPDTLKSIYETRQKNSPYYVQPEVAFERTRTSDFDIYCSIVPNSEIYTTEQLMLLYEDYKQRWCEAFDKYADAGYTPSLFIYFESGYESTEPTAEDYSYLAGLEDVHEYVSKSGLVNHLLDFDTLENTFTAKDFILNNSENVISIEVGIEQNSINLIDDSEIADFSILGIQKYSVPAEIAFESISAYHDFAIYCKRVTNAENYSTEQLETLYNDYKSRWIEQYSQRPLATYDSDLFVIFAEDYDIAEPTMEEYSYLQGLNRVSPVKDVNGNITGHYLDFDSVDNALSQKDIILNSNANISEVKESWATLPLSLSADANPVDLTVLGTAPQPIYGDLDGDNVAGKVADVIVLSKYLKGSINLSNRQRFLADVNYDNIVDTSDLQTIIQYLTNEITTF